MLHRTAFASRLLSVCLLLSLALSTAFQATALAAPTTSAPAASAPAAVHPQTVSAAALPVIADFEPGVLPAGFVGFADSWDGSGSTTTLAMVTKTVALPTVPALANNTVVSVTYNVAAAGGWGGGPGYAGIAHTFAASQDWSAYQGFSFWYYGGNSSAAMRVEIRTNGTASNPSDRYVYSFTDDFTGWRYFAIPWTDFVYRTDYEPGPKLHVLNLAKMWGYGILIPGGVSGTFYLDNFAAYGGGLGEPTADFSSSTYQVRENAGQAVLAIDLSAAATAPISVTYQSVSGTAAPGVNYTPVSGTLVFPASTVEMTFTVPITDDLVYQLNKTVVISLTSASGAKVGTTNNPATLSIVDTDTPPDVTLVENFENGLPGGLDAFGNKLGFSTWGSTANNVTLTVTTSTTDTVFPGGPTPNSALKVTSNIESWGGFTFAYRDGNSWGSADWSRYDGLRFWFYGTRSGSPIQIEIFDNEALETTGDSAERYYQRFADDFTGWKQISLPFSGFQRRTDFQPGGAPNDGLNLTDVAGYAFNLPAVATTTVYFVDQVELYGDLSRGTPAPRVEFSAYAYGVTEGALATAKLGVNITPTAPITVAYVITPDTAVPNVDYVAVPLSGTLTFAPGETLKTIPIQTQNDLRLGANKQLKIGVTSVAGAALGYKSRTLVVVLDNNISDPTLIDDFEDGLPTGLVPFGGVTVTTTVIPSGTAQTRPGQLLLNTALSVTYDLPAGTTGGFTRRFDKPQDLSHYNALSFWYYGAGTGQPITLTLLDNPAADPGPAAWTLAWSDEFTGTNGAAPNPANWGYDTGGSGNGNNEWEYYTDSRQNSALDGNGNLVIMATTNADTSLKCATSPNADGTCYATSARLISAGKQQFTYGRVEARIKIPKGQGLWPAFWMLGNDISKAGWPTCGEVDIMENIGKPSEQQTLYGTIHGPGYSGGSGIGSGPRVVSATLADDFHIFAVEWQPTQIRWFVDGTNYFTATTASLPNGTRWVYDHPFFILLNVAVGGNWPGYPDGTTQFPQNMTVDYVRVYQAPDTAERFEAAFTDTTVGWKRLTLPLTAFHRSAQQPAGAPNDGLTLTKVGGYQMTLAAGASATGLQAAAAAKGSFYLDEIHAASLHKLFLPVLRR